MNKTFYWFISSPTFYFRSKNPLERHFVPAAALFKYEIEHLNANDNDISEIMIVDSTQIRRKKLKYSRDRSKLFLKQHVEQDDRGIFVIKAQTLEQYNVKNVMWETIFDGPKPNFQSSKRFEKAVNGVPKKQKQESMAKYLQKSNGKKEVNKEKRSSLLLEQMKKREEDFKKQKQLNEEQRALQRQKKKEDSLKMAQHFKAWTKPKEDLELEDHMVIDLHNIFTNTNWIILETPSSNSGKLQSTQPLLWRHAFDFGIRTQFP